jgi:chromosome segregation ATPase
MQISAIVLYGKNGEKRELPFKCDKVNIFTGKSESGNSVIGDIIDYCFGSSTCNIAEGFVRERVAWYGLQLIHNGEYLFIARKNPLEQINTNSCCYLLGKEIPDSISHTTPISNDGLKKILSAKLGISDRYNPPTNISLKGFDLNISHSLFYCLQNQDELTSHTFLFHKQAKSIVDITIRNTLPYFLQIIDENHLVLESERIQLKRKFNTLSNQIQETRSIKGNGLQIAPQLFAEAQEVGLLPDNMVVDFSNYTYVRETLKTATSEYKGANNNVSGMDRISMLQNQLEKIRHDIDEINIEIRNTEEFLGQIKGYKTEVDHQLSRLGSIGLFELFNLENNICPFCSKPTENLPNLTDIRNSITNLTNKLNSVSRDQPNIKQHTDQLIDNKRQLLEEEKKIKLQINALYAENEAANQLKDLNARQARVIGRISLWLESVNMSDETDQLLTNLKDLEDRIANIDKILDTDTVEGRKDSVANMLSSMMSKWAKELELEFSKYLYRLDLDKLTVVIDMDGKPVSLQQTGSGLNWLGCHLITLFALHFFFIRNNRPVPRFLFLDQPSQVLFPSETDRANIDSKEIRNVYKFFFDRITEFNSMQLIVVDHADLKDEIFQNAVVENWWDGKKLVPTDWEPIKN